MRETGGGGGGAERPRQERVKLSLDGPVAELQKLVGGGKRAAGAAGGAMRQMPAPPGAEMAGGAIAGQADALQQLADRYQPVTRAARSMPGQALDGLLEGSEAALRSPITEGPLMRLRQLLGGRSGGVPGLPGI